MTYNRALWLVLPVAGLIAGDGCGGPAPEPPNVRAPVSVARPAVAKSAFVGTASSNPASAASAWSTAATSQPAVSNPVAALTAVELPTAHLSHIRPVPLPDGGESKVAARPIGYTPSAPKDTRAQALPSSIVFKQVPGDNSLDEVTDSTLVVRPLVSSPSAAAPALTTKVAIVDPIKSEPKIAARTTESIKPATELTPAIAATKSTVTFLPPRKPEFTTIEPAIEGPALVEPVKSPEIVSNVGPFKSPAPVAESPKPTQTTAMPAPSTVVVESVKSVVVATEPANSVAKASDAVKSIAPAAEPPKAEVAAEPVAVAAPAQQPSPVVEQPKTVAQLNEPTLALPAAAPPTPKPAPAAVAMIEPRRPALPKAEAKVETKVESEQIEPTRAERTPEFIAVCQRAEGMNRHGFELAQHGAVFAARLEYLKSLETVAEALDSQRSTRIHRRMLAAGFKALDEADDFGSRNTPLGSELNVAAIVRSHRTPVLKDVQTDLSAQAAMSRYLTFAQEQLAAALGDVPQGSGALFGLGKIYSFPVEAHGPPDATGGAKSVAFYQASLMVDGRNFMAANELGVMLVGFGRLQEARSAFRHSLKVSSQPVVWENLAAVHRSLGENDLAQKAQKAAAFAATQMTNGAAAMTAYDVQWVDPATFARSKPIDADPIKPTPMSPASPASDTPKNVAGSLGFGVSGRK